MGLRVTRIKNAPLRRAAMMVVAPAMALLCIVLGVLAGVRGLLHAAHTLVQSWGPAWRGETADPEHPFGVAEVGLLGNETLAIHLPTMLLAQAAKFAPFVHHVPGVRANPAAPREEHKLSPLEDGGFRVTDPKLFATAVGKVIVHAADDGGTSPLHDMTLDVMEMVVDAGQPERDGWTWPRFGYAGQLDPRDE